MIRSGKYIGYLVSPDASSIVWGDNIDEIKDSWHMGCKIFESGGIDSDKLKELFPTPPARGIILEYFKKNLKIIYDEGKLLGELTTKELRHKKLKRTSA